MLVAGVKAWNDSQMRAYLCRGEMSNTCSVNSSSMDF